MKTIVVPTDFSANAANALDYALQLAAMMGARIILLNVFPVPFDFAARIEDAVEGMEKHSKSNLKKIIATKEKNEQYKGIPFRSLFKTGNVVHTILGVAKETKAEMIVMGTKGASGFKRVWLGSNTAEVMLKSDIPVLAVPEKAAFRKLEKMVYALDYLEEELNVLEKLTKIALHLRVPIETVHIAPQGSLHEQIMFRGLTEMIKEKWPESFTAHQLLVEKSFLKGIEDYLEANSGALLALAHHARPFPQSIFHKSISEEMVYHTQVPILVLPVG